ncbi:MAG: hypothetical protein DBX61_05300 [Clostridiales bacterium]|nr:MAG: hypothetical protein DBX61_05300 [Clostridiales bacterium]
MLFFAVRLLLELFYVLLIVRAVLSWVPGVRNRLTDFVYMVTEPVLSPVRNLLNRSRFGNLSLPIDLSFLVVLFILTFLLYIF